MGCNNSQLYWTWALLENTSGGMSSTVPFQKQGQWSLWHSEVHSITRHSPTCLLHVYTKLNTTLWFSGLMISYQFWWLTARSLHFHRLLYHHMSREKPMGGCRKSLSYNFHGTPKTPNNSNKWNAVKKKTDVTNLKRNNKKKCWISSSPPQPEVIPSYSSMFDTFTNHPGPPFVHPNFHSK